MKIARKVQGKAVLDVSFFAIRIILKAVL